MRLSSLKVSGFKSFADTTTLYFKENRTAVVGPNGCGKSNVIDAIRWVMGESSARQLRGGSMQDVIFTGTAQRKPVGMASVELRFDNTYGKLGGAYSAYSELSVRRQVTRDGKSDYFLNGTRCRRRDITDIFLGTGLGPRSYAIIEQGMISRLVDAKPDEMRTFVEEAAGVSRYQARRRETLQHLEQAEQNLARLHDIEQELEKQMKALERQVKSALHYKTLEQEIYTLKVELLSFQIEQLQQQQYAQQSTIDQVNDQFKEVRLALHQIEDEFQQGQYDFQHLLQQSAPLQLEWQNSEKRLAELTAQLLQKKNSLEQHQKQLQQLQQQRFTDMETLHVTDIQLDQLYQQEQQLEERLRDEKQLLQQRQQSLADLQHQQQLGLQEFNQQQQQLTTYQQQQQQLQSQSEQLNKQITRLQQQRHNLNQQHDQFNPSSTQEDIDTLLDEQQRLVQHVIHTQTQLEQAQQQLKQAQHEAQKCLTIQQEAQSHLKILQAEQKNLSSLLIQDHDLVTEQPVQSQLTVLDQLQLIDTATPYAALIEKVLATWLHAYLLSDQQPWDHHIARQLKTHQYHHETNIWHQQLASLSSLQTWIVEPQWIELQHIRIVDTLQQAHELQHYLNVGQRLLSLDGYYLGSSWQIALHYDDPSQVGQGLVTHQLRLKEIEQLLIDAQQQFIETTQHSERAQQHIQQQESVVEKLQQQYVDAQQQQQTQLVALTKAQSQQQAKIAQHKHLDEQLQQTQQQLIEDQSLYDELQMDVQMVQLKIDQLRPDIEAQTIRFDELAEHVEHAQQQFQQQQTVCTEQQHEHIQLHQRIELLEKDISFLRIQTTQHQQQYQQLQDALVPLQTEVPQLQHLLNEQVECTQHLQQQWQTWQESLDTAQQKQQQRTEKRQMLQQQDEQLRQHLETLRLTWQKDKSNLEHHQEQLQQLNHPAITGLQLDLEQHQQRLLQQQQRLEKIGAVNLLASEEYQQIKTRHDELNHQIQDVEHTVKQLRNAMQSIDQETKSLFLSTFDKINHELKILFPKIFNGGEAHLTLEEGWQSGVKLMARPPGKRNSSLALLSGGEKALTALALVFAIFRLNPAPFCVLDEVDAPLDDANVQRFCNLVKELSEHVQFIYITHNKLAMTMATDLLGVTMPEAGTSKLVTVSIEDAQEFGLMSEN